MASKVLHRAPIRLRSIPAGGLSVRRGPALLALGNTEGTTDAILHLVEHLWLSQRACAQYLHTPRSHGTASGHSFAWLCLSGHDATVVQSRPLMVRLLAAQTIHSFAPERTARHKAPTSSPSAPLATAPPTNGQLDRSGKQRYNQHSSIRFLLRHIGGLISARWTTDRLSWERSPGWSVLPCRSRLHVSADRQVDTSIRHQSTFRNAILNLSAWKPGQIGRTGSVYSIGRHNSKQTEGA